MVHQRRNLNTMSKEWKEGVEPGFSQLETFIKALQGIQNIPPGPADNPTWNSFFTLGGYHGQPFRGTGTTDKEVWGGYCNHGNILFPTWHRAYLLRFEEALRSIPGCEDVTVPYWDQLVEVGDPDLPPQRGTPYVPEILTTPTFRFKNATSDIPNPLYSYKLAQAIRDRAQEDQRYTKPVDYQTVRYPLSGLVGTYEARKETEIHNAQFESQSDRTEILNLNVGAWLTTGPKIKPIDCSTNPPKDLSSVFKRYHQSLLAPNYTVFSNTESRAEWVNRPGGKFAMSLESPHNAIHLALGGFFQKNVLNANPIPGANGDMGANEMAGFDPIFFLHHCFIDYAFWRWQVKNKLTSRNSLTVDKTIKRGTTITTDTAGYPLAEKNTDVGQALTLDTPLHPFRDRNNMLYTSHAVTDIAELGYEYEIGSLDPVSQPEMLPEDVYTLAGPMLGEGESRVLLRQPINGINRVDYRGSFVIKVFALLAPPYKNLEGDNPNEMEVAREPMLGRWNYNTCRNCQNKLEITPVVAFDRPMLDVCAKDAGGLPLLRLEIQRLGAPDLVTGYPSDDNFVPSWPADGPPKPTFGDPVYG